MLQLFRQWSLAFYRGRVQSPESSSACLRWRLTCLPVRACLVPGSSGPGYHPVIGITVNYRLNIFGWLATR